ncbi:hypothetical protein GIB67_024491 [Kingdonia uniflora]|uniref:CCHC-type domain-containing protein n=1 Tax=Kingdonia uniflora TaxID=39325 RepID=A0A7J7LP38_9MAGN|nr:hypothetical protein GIB67_024491 [Kingdonia uniflora]
MVSKRQKEARKRFLEEHPDLAPKPTPPQNPEKKQNKSKFKKKGDNNNNNNNNNKKSFSKHPLRVPGMKPGESCFICKAKDHIAKLCPQKDQWERHKICLLCRQHGHSLKNCPDKSDETGSDKKFCYNCGKSGHSLSKCAQPLQDGGTKFANCFICNENGHLSKNCPKNAHGIYPKGGSCKECGGITHLAKDCPNKGNRNFNAKSGGFRSGVSGNDCEGRTRVTKLISGDDLDDDFTTGGDTIEASISFPSQSKANASESIGPRGATSNQQPATSNQQPAKPFIEIFSTNLKLQFIWEEKLSPISTEVSGLRSVKRREHRPQPQIPVRERLSEGTDTHNPRPAHKVTQTTSQYVTEEYVDQRIKELIEAQALGNKEDFAKLQGSPIAKELFDMEVPTGFHTPKIRKYKGTDLKEHIQQFRDSLGLYSNLNHILCRLFARSLQGEPLQWFHYLPEDSILTFD